MLVLYIRYFSDEVHCRKLLGRLFYLEVWMYKEIFVQTEKPVYACAYIVTHILERCIHVHVYICVTVCSWIHRRIYHPHLVSLSPVQSLVLYRRDSSLPIFPYFRSYYKVIKSADKRTTCLTFTADNELSVWCKPCLHPLDKPKWRHLNCSCKFLSVHWCGNTDWQFIVLLRGRDKSVPPYGRNTIYQLYIT